MENREEIIQKITKEVYEFFADQCEVEIGELTDDTNIIEDINGDSLMFLQLLEGWRKEYSIDIEFRVIGKYITKNPVDTLGKAIQLATLIICDREKFISMVG